MTSVSLRGRLQGLIPPTARETYQRIVAGVLTFLTGYQVLDADKAALWSQLALGTISALFALLYATSTARVALYALVGPVGGVLMAYGIISDVKWAVLVASIGQVFGVATAAAKVVELVPVRAAPALSGLAKVAATPDRPAHVVIAVASPREARAVRRHRAQHRAA
ncbi:MAG: hypothetical protein JO214_14015 [Frankiaceae bacterium]|nr:hypothetical protein [Frankiaceae bacterium]